MIKTKNERGAGRKPSLQKGKSVTFYLNPTQEKATKNYVANLKIDNDLLAKLKSAIYHHLYEKTEEVISEHYKPRYTRSSDEVQGYDLEDFNPEDVSAEWGEQAELLASNFRDEIPDEISKIIEKIIEEVDYG